MGHWEQIRKAARKRRAGILGQVDHGADAVAEAGAGLPDMPVAAGELLKIVSEVTGIESYPMPSGDALLGGAEAMLSKLGSDWAIFYDQDMGPRQAAFAQAHEYAHFWLHHNVEGEVKCDSEQMNAEDSETSLPIGLQRVEGYGPGERREREANIFAREFLLPTNSIRRWHLEEGLSAGKIAQRTGMPLGMVCQQLAYALLVPMAEEVEDDQKEDQEGEARTEDVLWLDESQQRAAYAENGPLLIDAGPGTGKTRTLVGRIVHLLQTGIPARSILALTFSNKAAEEMRSRVAEVVPETAGQITMLTFHAFGLELLHKYGTRLGLPSRLDIVDAVEAIMFLERALPGLKLEHHANLYEPTMWLPGILKAISRAKDELVDPEEFTRRAMALLDKAGKEEEGGTGKRRIEAEKALEIARVYALYQAFLERRGLLDFGDLISKSVRLLKEHSDVRGWVQQSYSHILVDEYQDVNRASALLLREVAADGRGLWAVGDARQSIYRFRGASPSNMSTFSEDFPGAAVLALEVNYRSQPAVVSLLGELGQHVGRDQTGGFRSWRASKDKEEQGGRITVGIADDEDSEYEALAEEIEKNKRAGIAYRDQAVLCRSHSRLAKIAGAFERMGLPALYLGDLFERPEVRDLLSLLALTCEQDGHALVRIARFPEYSIGMNDVRIVLSIVQGREGPFVDALDVAIEDEGISLQGRRGLNLLREHLRYSARSPEDTAWDVLTRYLFQFSGYLSPMLGPGATGRQQQRLAIYQLLQVAQEHRRRPTIEGSDPKQDFLNYVRHLEVFGEEKALRQAPEWADRIEAVRLLTIHASKGLEFRAVFVPGLGAGVFPSGHGNRPSLPKGIMVEDESEWHEEEERCLFFVALSRAKDVLHLSRARHYRAGQRSQPSKLLKYIESVVPMPSDVGAAQARSSRRNGAEETQVRVREGAQREFSLRSLESYIKCPQRYYYIYELGLVDKGEDGAYVRFHRSVFQLIDWVRDERMGGRAVSETDVMARLEEVWADSGLRGHTHEEMYRSQAVAMVKYALERHSEARGRPLRPKWRVSLEYGQVVFRPDHVELVEDVEQNVVHVQRLRTGRQSESDRERRKEIYGLYHAGASEEFPNAEVRIQTIYLGKHQEVDVSLKAKEIEDGSRMGKYNEAMRGIVQRDFHPDPDDHRCPRCGFFFICPMAVE